MIRSKFLLSIKTFFACAVLLLFFSTSVYAFEKQNGSITIYSHYNGDESVFIISDTSYELFKISDYVDGKYVNKPQYAPFPVYSNDMDASQCRDLAKKLETFVNQKNITYDLTSTSNQYGYSCFTNLEQGVYLIIQNIDSNNTDQLQYYTNPIIISIPIDNEEGVKYDVYIEPKFSKLDNPTTELPTTGDTNSPPTGHQLNYYIYMMLFIGSSTILIVVSKKRNRINKK